MLAEFPPWGFRGGCADLYSCGGRVCPPLRPRPLALRTGASRGAQKPFEILPLRFGLITKSQDSPLTHSSGGGLAI